MWISGEGDLTGRLIVMIGIYFSGTGNSRYALEVFCREYDKEIAVYSIEDKDVLSAAKDAENAKSSVQWIISLLKIS